mmetsp:Transcript_99686/g.270952  ORF Transcript_99686/g.270952 Transcript_99686/m.270952 type:complete len:410 (-) Transcript_99686:274-1503(-)
MPAVFPFAPKALNLFSAPCSASATLASSLASRRASSHAWNIWCIRPESVEPIVADSSFFALSPLALMCSWIRASAAFTSPSSSFSFWQSTWKATHALNVRDFSPTSALPVMRLIAAAAFAFCWLLAALILSSRCFFWQSNSMAYFRSKVSFCQITKTSCSRSAPSAAAWRPIDFRTFSSFRAFSSMILALVLAILSTYSPPTSLSSLSCLIAPCQPLKLAALSPAALLLRKFMTTFFDFSFWLDVNTLSCRRASWSFLLTLTASSWPRILRPITAALSLPHERNCLLAESASDPACTMAILSTYGLMPGSVASRTPSTSSGRPCSRACRTLVAVATSTCSCRKNWWNSSLLCCGIFNTSASICLSSSMEANLSSSSLLTATPYFSISLSAAVRDWSLSQSFDSVWWILV